MKKAIRFFSLAMAVLMLLPLLSAFPVRVSATEQTYATTHNGELLRTVNFNSEEWSPAFADSNNCGANVAISNDGSAVTMTVTTDSYKRAMWGGFYSGEPDGSPADLAYEEALGAVLPIEAGATYTMTFDLTLGNDNVALGIQVDGSNALLIRGNGQSYWYEWNTSRVGATSDNNEKWHYHIASGTTTRDAQTFAVVIDCDAKTMSLYVKDIYDGAFYFCRSLNYENASWASDYFRCRVAARAVSGTPDESYTAELSNLNIYKGNAMNPLFGDGYRLPYWSRPDDAKLLDVNFNADEWDPEFATANNCGADVSVSSDGTVAHFTVLSSSYKRAMWGGYYSGEPSGSPETLAYNEALGAALPMEPGAKYTMVFDLTFGHDNVALGVQVDGTNALVIRGNGQSRWYGWNDIRVDETSDNNEKWTYHIAEGSTKRDAHTFAVTVDYDAKTMALYVLDENDGCFYLCRSMTYDGSDVWDSAYFRCRLNVRAIGGTPNANYTADLANLKIFKGNVMSALWDNAFVLPYASREDDELLLKVNFGSDGWDPVFATENNCGADVNVSSDGSTVGFTVLSSSYKRAMWGGFYSGEPDGSPADLAYEEALGALLPMGPGARYTMTFDLTLGDDHVALGVQVDGRNALSIQGSGQSRWYGWNDLHVTDTSDSNEKWTYHMDPETTKRDTHTFAVTVDYDTKTMALFIKDGDDFYFCRSMTYDGSDVWASDYFRCRLCVRSIGGTPNANYTAEISDLMIYKGLGPAVSRLSVMSYNVEMYGHGGDGWDGRHPAKAIETILDQSPDIVGLQEVNQVVEKLFGLITIKNEGWDDYLPTLISNGYAQVRGDTSRDCWCDLYYKTDRFTELDSGYKRYSALGSEFPDVPTNGADPTRDKLGRMFTWALLKDKHSGKTTLAISTHLHYRKNTDDNASTEANALVRQYEIRLLLAWIEAQTFDYDAVVVVGDMNAHCLSGLGKTTINIFKDEGDFSITRDVAKVKGDVGSTLAENDRTTRPEWVFDYVLTRGSVENEYFTVVDNKIDNGGTSYPSDHLPILSKFTVY